MENIQLDQLDKINEILQKYVEGIGINLIVDNSDISSYFNYSSDQIRSLDAEDCDMAAGILLQKSIKLQLELNKHIRTKNWANESIKAFLSADKLSNAIFDKYIPYDIRRELAAQNHDHTRKLFQLIRTTQLYIDTLQYIPTSLKNQADFFTNLAKSKRRSTYEAHHS
jgi:hypothetical protein